MWIKLHMDDNRPVVIQTQNIADIHTSFDPKDNDMTVVGFIGSSSNYVLVKETIDDIIYILKGDYLSGV